MLVNHKAESNQWKGSIGLKIDQKVKINIAIGKFYTISPLSESLFGVFVVTSILNVDIKEQTCSCRG